MNPLLLFDPTILQILLLEKAIGNWRFWQTGEAVAEWLSVYCSQAEREQILAELKADFAELQKPFEVKGMLGFSEN
jgi:hypothetical protein